MSHRRQLRTGAALLAAALVSASLSLAGSASAAPADGSTMNDAFAAASEEFDVPRDLLVAVGYGETHLDGHAGEPSAAGGYGVMHLVSNPERRTLERAAELTGLPAAELKRDTPSNIRGGAAVLRSYADALGLDAGERDRIGEWYPVVAEYGGADRAGTARLYADTVYGFLNQGLNRRAAGGERVGVEPRKVEPDRGEYEKARPPGVSTGDGEQAEVSVLSTDYGPAHWVAAHPNNYQPGRSAPIDKVVIHVTQGSYAGSISWFQNGSAGVSSHYVVRSSDGDVTQMVRDADTAYHARSANPSSLGIEHEGYVDNPSWFTDSMYRSSAALTRHLCDRHGIPEDRAHILGHNELPGNDHTDPGPHWNWDYYMQLVTSGGGPGLFGGSPTDFTGDGVDDIVTFTQNPEADVYVAPSTRAGFGEAKEWHDFFAPGGETPLTGDFNGDHKDDVVTFTKGPDSDVYVALSNGNTFGTATVWHDHFAPGSEVPAVGDVNGDGYDDIVTFTHDADAKVYVALSNGTDGFHTATVWHDFFAPNGEFPALGDIDGDGDDDLITFTQGTTADVYAALSNGKDAFGTGQLVHDHFAPAGELPRVGDVNGDKKDDILAFTQGTESDVYVALSDGNKYGPGVRWNDFFSPTGEFPYVGDYDGDGKDDIVTFTHNTEADVYVSVSNGTDAFVDGRKWHDFFGTPGETSL
ncbi:N-acetylmuramoyl-L-alanine amidase [Streptomyces coelicoflavus]|uniref:N-acetylmuramoyl-L-alanine amidase n=1 Tax=Streptomyces coelicoflavus TaxID=285562 RepID=A0A6N9UGZ7_9ACTN|nr:N-acetylmuramoyl-L-alanine amidase [Streptomyces coelicoflavus]